MGKDYRRDERRKINSGMRWGLRWVLGILALVAVIGAGVWAFQVITSDVKGRGDVTRINNSAPNRIQQQRAFLQLYNGIKAADQNVGLQAQALKADPKDRTLQTNHTGAIQHCQGLVADYNTKARETTAMDWRDADLPEQIDPADPATDCKGD